MQKNIVHIMEASATGTLAMASLLANGQADKGHNVTVIYSIREETPQNLDQFFNNSIKLIYIDMGSIRSKLLSLIKIRKTIANINPSVIFMHSSFAGFLGRVALLGAQNNSKLFYIPHCISFMRKDISGFKKVLFVGFEWIGALKKCDYIACSRSEQIIIQKHIPFRKCHLVENALNLDDIPTNSITNWSLRAKNVVTVGQIRKQKGPELFALIAKQVKANDPSINFTWIGDGETDSKETLIQAGVQVTGWVKRSEVWSNLQEAKLYLSTAQWEGMPVSVIESSFAGVPVVVSDCTGNVDVVEHGKTGMIFSSPEEATSQILSMFENSNAAIFQAESALKIAQQRFSSSRYSNDMELLG